MKRDFELTPIWIATLAARDDSFEPARSRLRESFLQFRERTSQVVAAINSELPGLTVHDVTHLDALWRIASEIVGPNCDINPAEAFVLGGAILLHDAAHALAAYPGGLSAIRATVEWKDLVAQRFDGQDPVFDSERGKAAVFEVLRQLHAQQSNKLLSFSWTLPTSGSPLYLLSDDELRNYYGGLIGVIAASHHWSAHRVSQEFSERIIPAPGFLTPANWVVDALKVALILRTADAAHIDDLRAPLFAFALRQPSGSSLAHWQFQSKLGQTRSTEEGELCIASANSFQVEERGAWWLAYDTACMIDRELRAAHSIMRDEGRMPFKATSVLGLESPDAFARHVQTEGWTPVDVSPRINNIPQVVEMLGGANLYGGDFSVPLRELIQNACDAVRALRTLGGLGENEGEVVVSFETNDAKNIVLSVTDTGVGMSRHVLTHVLMDFGHSLWGSDGIRDEWPGLASRQFSPAGQFGIGFFSVFMLGNQILVNTRRQSRYRNEESDQWTLGFDDGLNGRPWLRKSLATEELPRSGTRVSVLLNDTARDKIMERLHGIRMQARGDSLATLHIMRTPMPPNQRRAVMEQLQKAQPKQLFLTPENLESEETIAYLSELVAWLCPASEVTLKVRCGEREKAVVEAGDWDRLADKELLARLQSPYSTALVRLKGTDGRTAGRIGLGIGWSPVPATLVHHGIRCGQFGVMTGLALAAIPTDVHRQKAIFNSDAAAWCEWLKEILPQTASIPWQHLRILHGLCPILDLPIAIIGGSMYSLPQCRALIDVRSSIMVFYDDLNQMAWDPPAGLLGMTIQFNAEAWIFPSLQPHRIEEIPVTHEGVDYRSQFETMLKSVWGEFEIKENVDGVVGLVGVQPLMREAFIYSRKIGAPGT